MDEGSDDDDSKEEKKPKSTNQKKKKAAEAKEKSDPSVIPRYSMVMFHPEIPYKDALVRSRH